MLAKRPRPMPPEIPHTAGEVLLLALLRADPDYPLTPDDRRVVARMIQRGVQDPALYKFTPE